LDVKEGLTDEDRLVAEWLQGFKGRVLCLLNKVDSVPSGRVQEVAGKVKAELGDWTCLRVSALKGQGVQEVLKELKKVLPQQPALFPEEDLTDKSLRDLSAELIREQCFLQLRQEIPYGVAVLIDKFEEKRAPQPIVIQATIYVEKDSQKGVVIGAGGKQLKAIGSAARARIEDLVEQKVFLELWVKVLKNWRKDEGFLKKLGYGVEKGK
jgi:GTP-binding protein Era